MLRLSWSSDCPRRPRVRIEYIDGFDARGKKFVYGRGDGWIDRREGYHMDIWRDRNGLLFARFWSRCKDVDDMSIVIHGIPRDAIPERVKGDDLSDLSDEVVRKLRDGESVPFVLGFVDYWIPKAVRDEYAQWIEQQW